MPRQVRIEFAGAAYHVMCRGDRGEAIFEDDTDRECFVETLAQASKRAGWLIHAYVLMGNHYHHLLETPEPNLVRGMTWLQTTYTVRYNARHRSSGHLYGGRYKAVLVETSDGGSTGDAGYFSTLLDYIHLNPVRAGLIEAGGGRVLQVVEPARIPQEAVGQARVPRDRQGLWLVWPQRRPRRQAAVCRACRAACPTREIGGVRASGD